MRRLASWLSVQQSRGLYANRTQAEIGTHRHRHNIILTYKYVRAIGLHHGQS